jgi:hypothetical protein
MDFCREYVFRIMSLPTYLPSPFVMTRLYEDCEDDVYGRLGCDDV